MHRLSPPPPRRVPLPVALEKAGVMDFAVSRWRAPYSASRSHEHHHSLPTARSATRSGCSPAGFATRNCGIDAVVLHLSRITMPRLARCGTHTETQAPRRPISPIPRANLRERSRASRPSPFCYLVPVRRVCIFTYSLSYSGLL